MVADSTSALRAFFAHHALLGGHSEADLQSWIPRVRTVHLGPGDEVPTGDAPCLIARGRVHSGGRLLRAGDVFRPKAPAYAVSLSTLLVLPNEAVPQEALTAAAGSDPPTAPMGRLDLAIAGFLQAVCVLLGALPLLLAKPLIDRGVLMRDATLAPLVLGGLATAAVALGAALGLRQLLLTLAVSELRARLGAQGWQEALHAAACGDAAPVRLHERLQRQAARLLRLGVRAPALLHDGVALPIYAGLLMLLSLRVALWGAVGLVLSLLAWAVWRHRNRRAQAAARGHQAQLASFVAAHGDSPWAPHQRMARHLEDKSRATSQRAQRAGMRGRFYAQGARTTLLVAVLALGTQAARHETLSLGTLVASAGVLDGLAAALSRLLTGSVGSLACRRRRAHRGARTHEPAPMRPRTAAPSRGEVRLRGVHLAYPNAPHAALQGLDLQLDAGETLVVYGPSGSGKTSLARLLSGQAQPHAGEVHIDGVAPPIAALHSIGRTPWIWHGTVRDNLAMHDPGLCDAALRGVARIAGWDIGALPQGLDTPLRSEGALDRLQATQLAIARALAQQPCVLILDDTLEGLDTDRKVDLVRRLQAFTPRPTLVLLARTLLPAALGLRALRLERGRLVTP